MSDIINAIRDCHINKDVESCHKCSAWTKENYLCTTVRQIRKDIARELVQDYDILVAEVERLKQENVQLREDYSLKIVELMEENRALRKALKKCSPIHIEWMKEGGEYFDAEVCVFCEGWYKTGRHTDDCEYLRLVGGN
jgi:hypothetical protein